MTKIFDTIYHPLQFKKPSGTSRGILTNKDSWLMTCHEGGKLKGVGECSIIPNLSIDNKDRIPEEIVTAYRGEYLNDQFPAVSFGREILSLSMASIDPFRLYDTGFSAGEIGIPINGLIWMGSKRDMSVQIEDKIKAGFRCIKMKIGAIDFEEELSLLSYIRSEYDAQTIELRVDANGAFSPLNALDKLKRLAEFELHSIEQPIRQGQAELMARLCQESPLDIALDEELIGISNLGKKRSLIENIKPQYIILKPSLLGGFRASEEWIQIAIDNNVGWWATSALEANVGLNAIAQWTSSLSTTLPQGLGTGGLYTNNINSPLNIKDGHIWYDIDKNWDTTLLS